LTGTSTAADAETAGTAETDAEGTAEGSAVATGTALDSGAALSAAAGAAADEASSGALTDESQATTAAATMNVRTNDFIVLILLYSSLVWRRVSYLSHTATIVSSIM
jgi:hypothetical protein